MSIKVKEIDMDKVKAELKTSHKLVQKYVKLLKSNMEGWEHVCGKAITKIKELTKEVDELKEKLKEKEID